MNKKHGCYTLNAKHIKTGKVSDPFYLGYCSNRPLSKRLYEHCQGIDPYFMTDKEQMIVAILEDDDYELVIQPYLVKELYEQVDEESCIQELRNNGYELTNRAVGGVFQVKVKLADGSLVDPAKKTAVETRSDIKHWKNGRKPSKTVAKSQKAVTSVLEISNEEFQHKMKDSIHQGDLDFDSFCAITKARWISEHGAVFYSDPTWKPFECDFKLTDKRVADPYRDRLYTQISKA